MFDEKDQCVLFLRSNFTNENILVDSKSGKITCVVPNFPLTIGTYRVNLFLGYGEVEIYDFIENASEMTVVGGNFFGTGNVGLPAHCKVLTVSNWESV